MKEYMKLLVEENWHPNGSFGDNKNKKSLEVFRTDDELVEAQGSIDYFLDLATKVHFFVESNALQKDGSIKDAFLTNKIPDSKFYIIATKTIIYDSTIPIPKH